VNTQRFVAYVVRVADGVEFETRLLGTKVKLIIKS
jgi:hypothetical protein